MLKISAKTGDRVLEVEVERQNGHYVVVVDDHRMEVDVHKLEGDFYSILTEGRSYEVSVEKRGDGYDVRHGAASKSVSFSDPSRRAREAAEAADGPERVASQMPGKVVRILVEQDQEVEAGQGVAVIEAMKMENEITVTKAGRVSKIEVSTGDTVESGAVLLVVE
ncbi:MAG: biotin/lipoyl-binding protein [bacterium]|nr:biotin/lipoyl-binding protein [bacterium]